MHAGHVDRPRGASDGAWHTPRQRQFVDRGTEFKAAWLMQHRSLARYADHVVVAGRSVHAYHVAATALFTAGHDSHTDFWA